MLVKCLHEFCSHFDRLPGHRGGGCGNPWRVLREPLTYSQSSTGGQTSHWILKWEQSYETEPFSTGSTLVPGTVRGWVELMAIKIVSKVREIIVGKHHVSSARRERWNSLRYCFITSLNNKRAEENWIEYQL